MNKHNFIIPSLIVSFLIGVVFVLGSISVQKQTVYGGAIVGQEHSATSTRQWNGTALGAVTSLKQGYGSLNSVVITGAGAGVINFYDATTTDITKRTGGLATSSIFITSIPASAAAGDYIFDDVFFTRGLQMEIIGTAPTSTVTWR